MKNTRNGPTVPRQTAVALHISIPDARRITPVVAVPATCPTWYHGGGAAGAGTGGGTAAALGEGSRVPNFQLGRVGESTRGNNFTKPAFAG